VLRRDDIGSLEVGKAADLVAFRIDNLAHAGGVGDPVASMVTCAPTQVWLSIINGRTVVSEGQLLTIDLGQVIEQHNRQARQMLVRAGVA
jgi:cytosine/adenosine deaminase-related metal-dependent hydrolase